MPLAGKTIHRVWRIAGPDGAPRNSPWWFASLPVDKQTAGGRFDLPSPMGTGYFAASAVGAVLESLQAHLVSLPGAELRVRRLATVKAPRSAPPGARLTSKRLAGQYGVTAAIWADADRPLTQRWAEAFRRDGWWALYSGLQHDPSARLRGWALFDHGGAHPPSIGGEWEYEVQPIYDNNVLTGKLANYGVVVREPGELDFEEFKP